MEEHLVQGGGPTVPGWSWRYFQAPANQRSADGCGVSKLYGAVSTPGGCIMHLRVAGVVEILRVSEPGIGPYYLCVRRDWEGFRWSTCAACVAARTQVDQ